MGVPSRGPVPQLVSGDRLDSWKEIAAYLGRGTRTVQRWEQEHGLPVYRLRLAGQKQGSVYAYGSGLDSWWAAHRAALEQEAPEAPSPAAERLSLHRLVRVGALVTVLIAAAAAGWFVVRSPGPGTALRIVPLTSYPGLESYPSFSPDGRQVAFAWVGEKQDNTDIYVKRIGADPPQRLTSDPAMDFQPVWAPDGRSIAFLRSRQTLTDEVYVAPSSGDSERRLGTIHTPQSDIPKPFLAWVPDGRSLIVPDKARPSDPYALVLMSAISGEKRVLTHPPAQSLGDSAPAVSPDGKTLAFIRCATIGGCDVYLAALSPDFTASGEPKRLTSESGLLIAALWAAGGREILYVRVQGDNPSLWRMPASGAKPPQAVYSLGSFGLHWSISPRGDRLAYTVFADDRNIYRVDLLAGGKAGPPAKLSRSTRSDQSPDFSPDGKRIAFFSDRTGGSEIWVCDADGSNEVQLTSFGGPVVTSPSWSPDGTEIAFDAVMQGNSEIFAIPAVGGRPRRLTSGPANDREPRWSRDGRWIYFASDRSGTYQIWRMPAAGGPAIQLTKKGGYGAFESADRKSLYYAKAYGYSKVGLWRVPVAGGEEVEINDSLLSRHNFYAVEEGIYFIHAMVPEGGYPICFYRFSTGGVERVGTIKNQVRPGLSVWPPWQPRWLLYAVMEPPAGDLMLVENFQ